MNQRLQLTEFLDHRWKHPKGQATFAIYFWVAVVVIGGGGVWVELLPPLFTGAWSWDWSRVAPSLYTFFPAVAVTSAFDLVLNDKQMRSVRAFGFGTLAGIMCWLFLCVLHPMPVVSTLLGLIGSVISLVLWRIANGENPQLHDYEPSARNSSLGGSDKTTPAGSEGEYKLS
jgi:hypothetical protein